MIKRFIKWIKFNPPYAANADEWVEFDTRFKEEAPIRYAISRGAIRKRYWRVKFFFSRNFHRVLDRTLDRKHIVNTGLNPGYHNTSRRILYANFSLLVGFVENECSRMYASSSSERMINLFGWKAFLPWRIRIALKRNPRYAKEYGLEYLYWSRDSEKERGLEVAYLDDTISLYKWWTEERPNREEYKSPLSDIRKPDDHIMLTSTKKWKAENPELAKELEAYSEKRRAQEQQWEDEDTAMLIKLMKIRVKLFS